MSQVTQKTRFALLDKQEAPEGSKGLLEAVASGLGMVPNVMKAMANSPSVLGGYLGLSEQLKSSRLSPRIQEAIALAVGQENSCDYCLAAHTMLGGKAGLSAEEIMSSRQARLADPQEQAALQVAVAIVRGRGCVDDKVIDSAREAGLSDGEIVEVFLAVMVNLFTNYFNHFAGPPIDFPAAPKLQP